MDSTYLLAILSVAGPAVLAYFFSRRLERIKTDLAKEFSYEGEKGKNLATKEDIADITSIAEKIRAEHTTTIELNKSALSLRANELLFLKEKEFEVYREIWELAASLFRSARALRPIMDYLPSEEDQRREEWNRRYREAIQALRDLEIAIENRRPFYPESVFVGMKRLIGSVHRETIDFEFAIRPDARLKHDSYLKAQENIKEITDVLEAVLMILRKRIGTDGGEQSLSTD